MLETSSHSSPPVALIPVRLFTIGCHDCNVVVVASTILIYCRVDDLILGDYHAQEVICYFLDTF